MTIDELIEKISTDPESVEFTDVINLIDDTYHYTPTRFHNGNGSKTVTSETGTNEGSCKIFAFGKLNNLSEEQTLACFGQYYRDDVLGHPENDDHANIRNFMLYGWKGIESEGEALTPMGS